ncbi:bifunctional DNA primase/polymerase [Ligilactobacillus apodemi]|uniref:Prophage Lp4 protein 7, DNA replication n=1 Tax=Ligilactobacillus apodemi DSM 16634 = JCM 16172 TaxID=1423724 RepID=A0A0R1TZN9_9LACO|nr:bifunctional DNA primase/polymerase [Ligilactobacillus apodemi]KRL84085.1 prophage Lp4 protein 7, DNA replication [Ligilactobacillus apodemi DSM 16634 = JCM 16172]
MTTKNTALELAKHNFKVFPLVPNTKRPIKDQSYLTASNNPQKVAKWFVDLPHANLGLELASKSLLVVDIDNHNSASIRDTMQKMADQGCTLPTNTYIEQTPSGGLHFFYTGIAKKKRVTNFIPNVDLLADFTVIAPSVINGDAYRSINDQYNYSNIIKAPKWLLDVLNDTPKQNYSSDHLTPQTGKKWTGRRLDEIVAGVDSGGRNTWLTRQVGWLISTGAELETVYTITQQINRDYISPPLPDNEVNTIFKNIVRKEATKYEQHSR